MLNNLLMSDLETGAITFLMGMIVVFFGIAILVFVVWLMGKIIRKPAKEKKVEPAPEATLPQTPDDGISEELVAVITAAIYAYYQANNEKCEFTVRKIIRRN